MARGSPINLADIFKNLSKNGKQLDDKKKKKSKVDIFEGDASSEREEFIKAAEIVKQNGLTSKSISKTKNLCKKMKSTYKLVPESFLILVLYYDNHCSVEGLLKTHTIDSRWYNNVLNNAFTLFQKNMISPSGEESSTAWRYSHEFEGYLDSGEFKVPNHSLYRVIENVDSIANMFTGRVNSINLVYDAIIRYYDSYCKYEYCKYILDFLSTIGNKERYFVLYIIGEMILSDEEIDKFSGFVRMFRETFEDSTFIDKLLNPESPLIKAHILDFSIDESGKADKNKLHIAEEFKLKYLKDVVIQKRRPDDIIQCKDIRKKDLFFPTKTQERLDELTSLLSKTQFNRIIKNLKKEGMRTGFACIFSGPAGTGKTESVLQIAKKTGRDLIKVDASQMRSKWWGEDEKNVKRMFESYKYQLKQSKIQPILFLNEADAIFGRRLNVEGKNASIITSINAVQNIILDELEQFEGILIATTNLTENFDTAFERRFLYKIDFEKPTDEVRAKIWENMLKLDSEWSATLSKKYSFTGGQIENIFRKKVSKKVLYGQELNLEDYLKLCEEEKKVDKEFAIGFGH